MPTVYSEDLPWGEEKNGISLRCQFDKQEFGLWEPINARLELKLSKPDFKGEINLDHVGLHAEGHKASHGCMFGNRDCRQIRLLLENDKESIYQIWFNCRMDFSFIPEINDTFDVCFRYISGNQVDGKSIFSQSNSCKIRVYLERIEEINFYVMELLCSSSFRRGTSREFCEHFCPCYPVSNLREFGDEALKALEIRFYSENDEKAKKTLLKAIMCFGAEAIETLRNMRKNLDGEDRKLVDAYSGREHFQFL